MWVLVLARVLQGLATGLLITAMYVTMGEVYPDVIRPRIFAALASAWVVPGLVGPVVAGSIRQFFAEPAYHLVGAQLAFCQGFQRDEHPCGVFRRTSTAECGNGIDRRVGLNDVDHGLEFFIHGLKGDIL